jgi:hypothetical protein
MCVMLYYISEFIMTMKARLAIYLEAERLYCDMDRQGTSVLRKESH